MVKKSTSILSFQDVSNHRPFLSSPSVGSVFRPFHILCRNAIRITKPRLRTTAVAVSLICVIVSPKKITFYNFPSCSNSWTWDVKSRERQDLTASELRAPLCDANNQKLWLELNGIVFYTVFSHINTPSSPSPLLHHRPLKICLWINEETIREFWRQLINQ